jgi:hypothetical protein
MADRNSDWVRQRVIGWATGLFAPCIGLFVFCRLYFDQMSILECLKMFHQHNVLPHAISLAAIANLLFFFIFLKMNREQSAHGVLGATFLYVFVVVYLKFF